MKEWKVYVFLKWVNVIELFNAETFKINFLSSTNLLIFDFKDIQSIIVDQEKFKISLPWPKSDFLNDRPVCGNGSVKKSREKNSLKTKS